MAVGVTAPFTPSVASALGTRASRAIPHPLASVRFDWTIAFASAWFLAGLYLDGWAHNTIPSLETFFTPWHGVLYSGFLVTLGVLAYGIGRNHVDGRTWWQAVPAGYELSLIGGLLFVASGIGDMLWHIAFGIEANVDALLSPTHLALLLGGALLTTGPIRAAARRRAAGLAPTTWSEGMPRLLSLSFLLISLSFFTQFANLWGGPWLASSYTPITPEIVTTGGRKLEGTFLFQALSVAGVLIQSVLLAGFAVTALRPGRVPRGGFGLMLGLYAVSMIAMHQKYDAGMQLQLGIAALVGAVLVEFSYARLRPSLASPQSVRLFAALVAAISTATAVVAVAATPGVWWSIHLWTGTVVIAAAAGWLVAFLATPAEPREAAPLSGAQVG